ncbi:MAG: hypothetical protein Q9221_002106 [Calogaya cf. arnoldii]
MEIRVGRNTSPSDQSSRPRESGQNSPYDNRNNFTDSHMISRIEVIGELLQDPGVGAGCRVLVYQQAASEWICFMLAIMRLGSIHMPLDLRNPMPRLATVAVDWELTAVLVDNTTVADASQLNVPEAKIIDVATVAPKPSASVSILAKADSPAAILYTNGSSGTLKGIMVTHQGLRNEIERDTRMWKLGAEHTLQQSAYTFNPSPDQIYTGLTNGGNTVRILALDAVGGNSLLVIRLQSRNRQTFNAVIRLVDLLGANNLGQMPRKIEESSSVDLIVWDEETAPSSIPRFRKDCSDTGAEHSKMKTVLVTGGTGFLSKYLLPQLDASPDVDTIHVVAVRDKPSEGPLKFNSPKMIAHTVTTPLSAAAYVPPVDGREGYVATRWASERVPERSRASFGKPTS